MRNLVYMWLCAALGVLATAHGVSSAENSNVDQNKVTGQKADANTLLHDAKKATAAIVKNARADKDLDPKTPKNKPFWKSVQLVAKNLNTAETGLAVRSDGFFEGIANARKAEAQMKVDWQLTDSQNSKVIENGKKLDHALALLRTNFSKEAVRRKKGGELTDSEKKEFAKIKANQKQLLIKAKALQKEAKTDKAFKYGLSEIERQANQILKQPTTIDAYIATLYLLDVQIGLVRGYDYYVDKELRGDWLVVLQLGTDDEKSYGAWETSVIYDWAMANMSVDINEREEIDASENVSNDEINTESSYAANGSFEMSEAERDQVAAEENIDEVVASADEENVENASADEEGQEMSEDDDDDGG